MSGRKLIICGCDTVYALRLAGYLSGKKELALQVNVCTSPQQIRAEQEDRPEILLFDGSCTPAERERKEAEKIFVLTDEGDKDLLPHEIPLFKYQSGEEILSQIIQSYIEDDKSADFFCAGKKTGGKLIGVYSPVHRSGRTAFAIAKGKELARNENVLYLNLEAYSGIGGYFPEDTGRTLSALLYYAKQESGHLGAVLSTLVRQMGDMDYVPPAMMTEDLKVVTVQEWKQLFEQILRDSIYDVLVLDVDECVQGLYEILNLCDTVYVPTADDRLAAAKIRQFVEILKKLGYEELCGRLIQCDTGRTTA